MTDLDNIADQVPARCPVALPAGSQSALRTYRKHVSAMLAAVSEFYAEGVWAVADFDRASSLASRAGWRCDTGPVHGAIRDWYAVACAQATTNDVALSLRAARRRTQGLGLGGFVDARVPEAAEALALVRSLELELSARRAEVAGLVRVARRSTSTADFSFRLPEIEVSGCR